MDGADLGAGNSHVDRKSNLKEGTQIMYTITRNGDGTLRLTVSYPNIGDQIKDYTVLESFQRSNTPSLIDSDILTMYADLLLQWGLQSNELDLDALNSRVINTELVQANVGQQLTDMGFTVPTW